MHSEPPPEGELIAGKYEVVRMIGQGGMGSVWEAWHAELNLRVACKFIDGELAEKKPEAMSRFRSEARAAAALKSKHVVDVYDFGTMSDGRPYMVMEYLEGESLESRLDRQGTLSAAETLKFVGQTGKALARAHAKGIVHRDLKPDNIFLVWDDEDQMDVAKVVDFGIAKFMQNELGASHATRSGALIGTPAYMAPEQVRGGGVVDHQADLWALGVVAYRCVTGELPFGGTTMGDTLIEICTKDPAPPSTLNSALSPSVDAWFKKALSRDKQMRFTHSKAMIQELAAALDLDERGEQISLNDFPSGDTPSPLQGDPATAGTILSTSLGSRLSPRAEQFWTLATVICVMTAGLVGFVMARGAREAAPLVVQEQIEEPVVGKAMEPQEPQVEKLSAPALDAQDAPAASKENSGESENEPPTPTTEPQVKAKPKAAPTLTQPKKQRASSKPVQTRPAPPPSPAQPAEDGLDIGLGY